MVVMLEEVVEVVVCFFDEVLICCNEVEIFVVEVGGSVFFGLVKELGDIFLYVCCENFLLFIEIMWIGIFWM